MTASIRQVMAELMETWVTTPILYPNGTYQPTKGTAWCRFTMTENNASNAALSRNFQRYQGEVTVQMFYPENIGDGAAMTDAVAMAAIWTNKNVTSSIRTRVSETRVIGNDGLGWFQINVITPFSQDVAT